MSSGGNALVAVAVVAAFVVIGLALKYGNLWRDR